MVVAAVPIRPENRARYPADWPSISHRIRDRDGWRCKWCGVENGALGGRDAAGRFHKAQPTEQALYGLRWPKEGDEWWCGTPRRWLRIVRIVLTVAHLDHTPENCADENLASLCQRCHNVYDMPHRRAGMFERAREGAAVADLFDQASSSREKPSRCASTSASASGGHRLPDS